MECQVDKKEHLRHVLLFLYHGGLSAVAAAEKIQAVYGEEAISDRAARKWFSRFREGNFDLSDSARSERPSDFDEEKLNALVHENPRQSTRELAEKIGCGHVTLSRDDKIRRVSAAGSLLPRYRQAVAQRRPFFSQIITELGWEVLPHPGYSPDLAPSDYHLFGSLAVNLRGASFSNDEGLQKWLSDFSKPPHFYRPGIEQLASRWEEVVNSEGEYIVD
ncbi:hypothetical protein M513_02837 [Trichuris suis]|uniref:Mos1 transposase HTH domain-containing protein n=1 Tax=Trichuris suis TaxID=68888 RepID=A0A085MGN6_9BILA|nr:hypothetical protein M513_02837 [Trichuris suis]